MHREDYFFLQKKLKITLTASEVRKKCEYKVVPCINNFLLIKKRKGKQVEFKKTFETMCS